MPPNDCERRLPRGLRGGEDPDEPSSFRKTSKLLTCEALVPVTAKPRIEIGMTKRARSYSYLQKWDAIQEFIIRGFAEVYARPRQSHGPLRPLRAVLSAMPARKELLTSIFEPSERLRSTHGFKLYIVSSL